MTAGRSGGRGARAQFVERVINQLVSQRSEWLVLPGKDFGISVTASGVTRWFGLEQVYREVQADEGAALAALSHFTGRVRTEMEALPQLDRADLILCVRSTRYMQGVRQEELVSRAVCGDLHAFVAARQPGLVMQGLSQGALLQAGLDAGLAWDTAQSNTEAHFAPLVDRLSGSGRNPRDGWRLRGDVLFQGSVLLVPAVLEALHSLAGQELWLGIPERGTLLAIGKGAEGAPLFPDRVRREFRRAMEPCSSLVFIFGEDGLKVADTRRPRGGVSRPLAGGYV